MSPGVGAQHDAGQDAERDAERLKYERMWGREEYRMGSPGEQVAPLMMQIVRPRRGSTVIDFGTGTGRGALYLHDVAGLDVLMVDFAANCLDDRVRRALSDPCTDQQAPTPGLRFVQHDLLQPLPVVAEYGMCTDVMEHIPPQDVQAVLGNILRAAQKVFFQIACEPDVMGALIGEPLHLTVQPYAWWKAQLEALDAKIEWSANGGAGCAFYVSAWQDGMTMVNSGTLNIEEARAQENVRMNAGFESVSIQQGQPIRKWQQAIPHWSNEEEVMILGGGPSLTGYLETIRQLRAEGKKLVALNGAYNWCLENGLIPSAVVVVDAREFNARFTHPVVAGCKYLIASQCDPAVLEGLPYDRTYLWHTGTEMVEGILNEQYGPGMWWSVVGGQTVLLRAIPLLRMLGFSRFHLFGCDSCLEGTAPYSAHHAYSQPENDGAAVIPVIVGGRTFACHPWMAAQAQGFIDLVKYLGEEFDMEIYGDGLLAWIVRAGAAAAEGMEIDRDNRQLGLVKVPRLTVC